MQQNKHSNFMYIFWKTFYFYAAYEKNVLKSRKNQLETVQFQCMWISHETVGNTTKTRKKNLRIFILLYIFCLFIYNIFSYRKNLN